MKLCKSHRSFFAYEIFSLGILWIPRTQSPQSFGLQGVRLLRFAAPSLTEKILGRSVVANSRKLLAKNF